MKKKHLTLSSLARQVKKAINTLSDEYWVIAEITNLSERGHCYMELVEKEDERVLARMRANIWAAPYRKIAHRFREATGTQLRDGLKVLVLGKVTYHEVFGLSLNITDIDPSYTLGEMALKRAETLRRLEAEGIIDLNRALELPMVLQRIAVISSDTAAGYGDFRDRLLGNPYGYGFGLTLFPAYVQGEEAESSMIAALAECARRSDDFDAVVMIRGGGSQVDLSCFDGYGLARAVAHFPLPVLSGIGHERDVTVIDRVANTRLITPTAVAEFIVARCRAFEDRVDALLNLMHRSAMRILSAEREALRLASTGMVSALRQYVASRGHEVSEVAGQFMYMVTRAIGAQTRRLDKAHSALAHGAVKLVAGARDRLAAGAGMFKSGAASALRGPRENIARQAMRIESGAKSAFMRHSHRLDALEGKLALLRPENVLARGYSITLIGGPGGRALRDSSTVKPGQEILTLLHNGQITSIIKDTKEGADGGS